MSGVTGGPVTGGDQPGHHLAQLPGSDLGRVITWARRTASSGAIQELRSVSKATTNEYGHPGS
jgi:hypothetical protein